MTTISILDGNWEIAFDDETVGGNAVAGLKMLRRTSGADTTVRTTNALYSAVADAADDFQAMGFSNPMLPVTPNAYTMEDKYFIPRRDIEFLKEGTINGDWTVASGLGVWRKEYAAVTDFVDGDIGRQVVESASGDTGTLLDFEVEPGGQKIAWIRPDTATDLFDSTSGTISVTADGGTGSNNVTVAASSGESQYSAIQTIGSVPATTEVFLYQDRRKMTDYLDAFQWWTTDPLVSLGIISILVRIKNAGTLIADGDVEVLARRYTAKYDNFRLNVAAGGFQALPLASSPDINNTNGYRQFTGSAGVSDFDVGNYIYVGATFATATKKGVLTKVGGTVAAPILDYYLIGDLTDFVNTDAVKEFDPVTEADGDGTCTAAAPIAAPGGPTDTAATQGGTITLALGGFLVDHDGDGNTEPYSVQFDTQGDVPISKVYERMKYVTRRGADEVDLFGAGVNIPGESYRGLDGLFEYDASVGAMTEGDDVFTTTGGSTWTARILHQNTTNSPTYISVSDQQTSLDAVVDNDVIEDETGTDDVTVHAGGTLGLIKIAAVKESPFGTFTGTQIFGARGVSFINPAAPDPQAYILTDDLNTLRNPPNTVSFLVTNAAIGDRVLVSRDTGTAGIIDKDQFGGLETPAGAFNGLADLILRVAGSIDTEVPQSGWIRVVDTGLQEEHKYFYDSRTTGALGEFTLRDIDDDGTVTTASNTQIIDTSANFNTPQTEVGMLVRNTFAGKTTHVWEVTNIVSDTVLDVRQLYGPLDATQDWDIGDTYTINALIGDHTIPGDYAASDDIFDLILDDEVLSGTSINNTFIKILSADFGTVVNVRQGKIILPFTLNQTQGDGNTTVTVVRTADTIAT